MDIVDVGYVFSTTFIFMRCACWHMLIKIPHALDLFLALVLEQGWHFQVSLNGMFIELQSCSPFDRELGTRIGAKDLTLRS